MLIRFRWRRIQKHVRFGGVVLCLSLQLGCDNFKMSTNLTGFYRETACTPAQFISQARQKLSANNIGTSEPIAEGKALAIFTDSIVERIGKQERMGKYKIIVQLMEGTNGSAVSLYRVEGKSKGIRERKWYDDEPSATDPPSVQQVWNHISTICVSQLR